MFFARSILRFSMLMEEKKGAGKARQRLCTNRSKIPVLSWRRVKRKRIISFDVSLCHPCTSFFFLIKRHNDISLFSRFRKIICDFSENFPQRWTEKIQQKYIGVIKPCRLKMKEYCVGIYVGNGPVTFLLTGYVDFFIFLSVNLTLCNYII